MPREVSLTATENDEGWATARTSVGVKDASREGALGSAILDALDDDDDGDVRNAGASTNRGSLIDGF